MIDTIPLVCVPFAGAGAAFFHSWNAITDSAVSIIGLQLPGRERRIDEPPYREAGTAVDGILPGLLDDIGGAGPVMLFGHSLGAILAYELAHRLSSSRDVDVLELMVSGSPGPWGGRQQRATGLPDEEFLQRVQEFAGLSHEALRHAEMRALILPTLRADVEMHETYRPSTSSMLHAPVTSFRGAEDRLVSAAQADEWAAVTSGEFHRIEAEGGHTRLSEFRGE